jgi:spoIIIJ-associated protein
VTVDEPDNQGAEKANGEADEASARVEVEAPTAGEAKWAAMKELEQRYPGLEVEHVEFDLVEDRTSEGESGPVRVVAVADVAAWRAAEAAFAWPEDPADRVREVLRRVSAHFGLRASVDIEEDEAELRAALSGPELGLFIGKHGHTIDSVQYLCAQAAYRGEPDRKRVVVDAGGYRERREAALRRQADRGVADAVRYGRPVELDSMSSQERRIVHLYLEPNAEVETHSEGDEPFRRIVLTPTRGRAGSGA